ncbi:MAG: hypothetical protein L0227_02340, partial [Chloroflexi bacterium]|nr:hypothetical protein [Chloroflexota bacterium]
MTSGERPVEREAGGAERGLGPESAVVNRHVRQAGRERSGAGVARAAVPGAVDERLQASEGSGPFAQVQVERQAADADPVDLSRHEIARTKIDLDAVDAELRLVAGGKVGEADLIGGEVRDPCPRSRNLEIL